MKQHEDLLFTNYKNYKLQEIKISLTDDVFILMAIHELEFLHEIDQHKDLYLPSNIRRAVMRYEH